MTESYNNTIHSSTKHTPISVNHDNEQIVRNILYPKIKEAPKKPKFVVGQTVRLVRKDNIFRKKYEKTFTDEIFIVAAIKDSIPITYGITAYDGEKIEGSFYEAELQAVHKNNPIYPIEKIIKKRKTKDGVELLVKWYGYSDAANSWVKQSELYPISETHAN